MAEFLSTPPFSLFFIFVIGCFFFIVRYCSNAKYKAAVTLIPVFMFCTIVAFMPQLEPLLSNIKVGEVEAKFRDDIDNAQQILKELKNLTIINAKTSYMVLAWQNRYEGPTAKDKQDILDRFDQLLLELKVNSSERDKITHPYVSLIGFDLYNHFTQALVIYVNTKKIMIDKSDPNTAKPESKEFMSNWKEWSDKNWAEGNGKSPTLPYQDLDYDFNSYLKHKIPEKLLNEREVEAAEEMRSKLLEIYNECKQKGGLTPDAAEYFDKYINSNNGIINEVEERFHVSIEN